MRVCILGSGLSALTLAKALVGQNIFVDIFCSKKKPVLNFLRTIGISKSNFDYFNYNIVNIEKICWKINKIEILTENLNKEKVLNFENENNQLFSIAKNFEIYEAVEKSLSKNKNFRKIYKNNYLNLLKKYDLVINTDYFSSITKKYFNKKILKDYYSYAYISEITHKKVTNRVATQIFTKYGPLAFLPISNTQTSLVFSIKKNKKVTNEDLIKLVNQYNLNYEIQKIEKFNSFKLVSFNLRNYYQGNILAFGDLLHKIHPLAGQGFNMTLRDIKLLLSIIKYKTDLGLPIDISINKEFEKKSKSKNMIFSNGIDLIHEFFDLESKTNNTLLSKSIKFLGKNSSINKVFTKIADNGTIF